MFAPIFSLNLKHKIHPRTVTVGKYDGKHPCLSCGTTASKVFIHNPHKPPVAGGRIAVEDSDVSFLNINQSVTALCAGKLDPSLDRDVLCIGSPTNLLAYDVHDNKDLFYKEVPDGINSLIIGQVSRVDCPIAIAGGNCTLIGFDKTGKDRFWTVTGDIVGALAIADFTSDGKNELLVGSEDFEIRAFHFDEIIAEITETDAVTSLYTIGGCQFGYGLANGTVGVYERSTRLWRIKSKNKLMDIHSFDLDGDGVNELICGWSNGKMDVRSSATGDVIFKDQMQSAIAGLVDADYRLDGKQQLMCCSVDGEIRGYGPDETGKEKAAPMVAEQVIKELSFVKQTLALELQNYEAADRIVMADELTMTQKMEKAAIPIDTDVIVKVAPVEEGELCVLLAVSTNNKSHIRMVVVFAEGLFDGESHIDSQFHVFDRVVHLPKFSAYVQTEMLASTPESKVTFQVNERLQRVAIWFGDNFVLKNELKCETSIDVKFKAIRGGDLWFTMSESGKVVLKTDDIDLAGDLIKSLALFLKVEHLQVTANFPTHMKKLAEIMASVDNLHSVTQRLAAEMTDHSNLIRSLVVKAEDARLQDDFAAMRKGYMELNELNRDLVSGYHVRSANHEELVKSLKLVNQIIQKAAHLRVGKYQTQVVSQCRDAIKNNQVSTLIKIIQAGSA